MKLNKFVIEGAAVLLFVLTLTITAVTNSGITANKTATPSVGDKAAENTMLANNSLEQEGTAGVTATLNYYQSAIAEETFSVENVSADMVSASEGGTQEEYTSADAIAEEVTSEDVTEEIIEETWEDKLEADWEDKLMAKVDESLYVREEADGESDVVGKLYKGDRALVIEEDGEWTKIESGEVIGYVKTAYCVTGSDALDYVDDVCSLMATSEIDGLRVREDSSEDAEIVTKLEEGDRLKVDKKAEEVEGWIAVKYNDETCYVSDEYVSLAYNTGKAITKEAEDAAIKAEQERIAAEEAAKKAEAKKKAEEAKKKEESKKSSSSSKSSSSKKSSKSSSSSSKPAVTQGSAVEASADELDLLAAIIYCEAGGTTYDAQVAVGAVIMNRVKSSQFPNTIEGVVYQKGQFSPARSGSLAKALSRGASSSCYKAAKEALSGVDNTGGCLYFRLATSGREGTIIGTEVFY